jgi:L-arabinose isomerase
LKLPPENRNLKFRFSKAVPSFSGHERYMADGILFLGRIPGIDNTNSRYRFSVGARKFVEFWNVHGPAHHCAVGIGHIAGKIEKLGKLLQMEVVRVC